MAYGRRSSRRRGRSRQLLVSEFPAGTAARAWDAWGINTHLYNTDGYGTGPYSENLDQVQDLGLRHVRDSFFAIPDSQTSQAIADPASPVTGNLSDATQWQNLWTWTRFDLIRQRGLKALPYIGTPVDTYLAGVQPLDRFEGWYQRKFEKAVEFGWADCIIGWEWQNEWDNSGVGGDGSSNQNAATRQSDFSRPAYQILLSNPALRDRPMVGPSPIYTVQGIWRNEESPTRYLDRGNMHPYRANRSENHVALNSQIQRNETITPTSKLWVTETGFQALDSPPVDRHDLFWPWLARDEHAIYLLRHLLQVYWTQSPQAVGLTRNIIERTYLYELINSFAEGTGGGHGDFGLFYHDGTINQAGQAVKNLVTLLGTKQAPATVMPLAYSVSGFTNRAGPIHTAQWFGDATWSPTDDNDYLYHCAAQRSDGTYLLFLWRSHNIVVGDVDFSVPVPGAWAITDCRRPTINSVNVTITITGGASLVQTANPRIESTFTNTLTISGGDQVTAPVDREVTVLRITP